MESAPEIGSEVAAAVVLAAVFPRHQYLSEHARLGQYKPSDYSSHRHIY
jgi:hypothetical protein